ncbi:MAG: AAA family ATPase [Theionarchaea archaeon]|nr:MAG: nitrogenase iron protein [Theionarchaea archaeon DG-70]MBU7011223.1 AAA family ATPase [Theionarchaea archaeon]
MRQIAIYGKGGIGKSTVASNLSVAFAEKGLTVMQIGCDPKRDSTRNLTGGYMIPTVLETYRELLQVGKDKHDLTLEDIVFTGSRNVLCVESGGPEPGVGCAGRGVLTAIEILRDLKAFEKYNLDIVMYDVLGDVVCGGFAQPIRQGYAREIYLVCSGEFMSLYAANNISKGIKRLAAQAPSRLAGVILNSRGNKEFERAVLAAFSEKLGSQLIHAIPRSPEIADYEVEGKTIVEGAPHSEAASHFRDLAEKILSNSAFVVPAPVELEDLQNLYREHLGKR